VFGNLKETTKVSTIKKAIINTHPIIDNLQAKNLCQSTYLIKERKNNINLLRKIYFTK
jgi:hypothetical protein